MDNYKVVQCGKFPLKICFLFGLYSLASSDIYILPWSNITEGTIAPYLFRKIQAYRKAVASSVAINEFSRLILPFANVQCLNVIDSFSGDDFGVVPIPVIFRRIAPAFITSFSYTGWVPFDLEYLSSSNSLICANGKFWMGLGNRRWNHCVMLDIDRYTANSRPHACIVSFSVRPPDVDVWGYNPLLRIFDHISLSDLSYPTTEPINFVLLDGDPLTDGEPIYKRYSIEHFIHQSSYDHHVVRALLVSRKQQTMYQAFWWNIPDTLSVLCRLCFLGLHSTQYFRWTTRDVNNLTSTEIHKLSHPHPREVLKWRLHGSDPIGIGSKMWDCATRPPDYALLTSLAKIKSTKRRMGITTSYIWISIFKNYSHFYKDTRVCGTDKWSEIGDSGDDVGPKIYLETVKYYGSMPYKYPLHLTDMYGFKFVGCGRVGVSGLPFYELTISFSKTVWLHAFFSSCSFVMLCSAIQYQKDKGGFLSILSKNVECLLRMYLQQDTDFSKQIYDCAHGKLVLIIIAFCVTILGNAYKNDNVYRMLHRRTAIHLETFEDLQAADFKVYSRALGFPFRAQNILMADAVKTSWKCSAVYCVATHIPLYITSNLWQFGVKGIEAGTNYSKVEMTVLRNTTLYSSVALGFSASLMKQNLSSDDFIRVSEILRNFSRIEYDALLCKLKECQKTAAVLNIDLVVQVSEEMARIRNISHHFHVGKESYFVYHYGFLFGGPVPPYLATRLHCIKESGILNWITGLVNSTSLFKQSFNEPTTKAGMKGNILVVFSIFGVGLIAAFLSCLIEWVWFSILRHAIYNNIATC